MFLRLQSYQPVKATAYMPQKALMKAVTEAIEVTVILVVTFYILSFS